MKRERVRVKAEEQIGSYFLAQSSHQFISSGSALLDCCLGGGWPLGRVVNIVGDRSTGKTLLAIEAAANFLSSNPNGMVYYLEAEAAFDKRYAEALGLPIKRVVFIEDADTVEAMARAVEKALTDCRRKPALFIVDSLDGLSDEAEQDRDLNKATFGAEKAKMMSKIFRRITRKLEKSNMLLFIISQTRDKIGVIFGERHTRSGGKALDFYASQIIWLSEVQKHTKTISGVKRVTGILVKARVKKNKVGLPYRECQFSIIFGYGVDSVQSGLEWLATVGRLELVSAKLNKSNIPRYIRDLEKASDDDYRTRMYKINLAIRKAWEEVEVKFLPKRRKLR